MNTPDKLVSKIANISPSEAHAATQTKPSEVTPNLSRIPTAREVLAAIPSPLVTDDEEDSRDRVILSPSASVFIRSDKTIQFGLDSRNAGIFQPPPRLAKVLPSLMRSCRNPMPISALQERLEMAGLDAPTTQLFLEELQNHGILIPAVKNVVAVLGSSSLARTITKVLSESGFSVRRPTLGESSVRFLSSLRKDIPVIPVNKLGEVRTVRDTLCRWPTVVPVTILDSTGVIGPIRVAEQGACIQCVDLYRLSVDPDWKKLCRQVPISPVPNPIVEYAVASRLAALFQPHCPAPGVTIEGLKISAMYEVQPFHGSSRETTIEPHPICPICWSSKRKTQAS
ncbi:hypothetical protein P4N68_08335 [Corynebacterium felinum]|uniref:Bacteriocin biosynthesis cyclodehydratase domain protein n=1 Tax=Corynebacterium felinum TaxID=131318 RepID=A0ABU2B8J8_9CORY|nr:hypothetical protein [Corynebacterium felinum]MDF5821086.1 hypothetical protein [Corynebacterium felinum]MDR7354952.1 hypothetical protein [Corynebacterium felinum]WJY94310.1 hypothetical protein CFELI_03340 [Corynebacterium felinum]